MADIIYENHLKNAYVVKSENKHLAITDTSCYQLSEETAWLIAGLPDNGGKELYFDFLSGLGLNEPQRIFNRLTSIGALRERRHRSLRNILGMVLAPKIRLFTARFQENILSFFGLGWGVGLYRLIGIFSVISLLGLLWGAALVTIGPERTLLSLLAGHVSGLAVFLLVITGSLIHELGHSFAAAASGIGLRPIGVSVYLIYPVFYTNVSGIEKVSLGKKVLIDCGGFVFQGVFLFLLLLTCSFTGNVSFAEAARWIMVMVFFNLNPLFRTDGYWIYKDLYSEFKNNSWARAAHHLYLVAFIMFSVYFLWLVIGSFESTWRGLNILMHSPRYFFSGGYRIVLGAYFILIGLAGGLRRFQEGRLEWLELKCINIPTIPRPTS
ncbi:MAG: hypothetical protein WCK76_00620 [Elusimicrobiota bacterium]